jgi:hypothetical protein
MAAMAMTGLQGTGNDTASNSEQSSATSTPPTKNGQSIGQNDGTPETAIHTESEFETPQKNLLGKFMSPKRKHEMRISELAETSKEKVTGPSQSEARHGEDDDDSPKREHPGDRTPAVEQKAKRSRIGSTRKGSGTTEVKETETMGSPMEMATPAKGANAILPDLTPVSARCIDFQKMRVNDSSSDPAVIDSPSQQS